MGTTLEAMATELRVVLTFGDFERAVSFFRDVLGLPEVASWQNDGGHGVLLDAGRATLEIFDQAQAAAIDQIEVGRRVAGQFRLALQVADSAAAAETIVRAQAEVLGGPARTPWGDTNVRVVGPEGVQLTLFTPER